MHAYICISSKTCGAPPLLNRKRKKKKENQFTSLYARATIVSISINHLPFIHLEPAKRVSTQQRPFALTNHLVQSLPYSSLVRRKQLHHLHITTTPQNSILSCSECRAVQSTAYGVRFSSYSVRFCSSRGLGSPTNGVFFVPFAERATRNPASHHHTIAQSPVTSAAHEAKHVSPTPALSAVCC
ncbi:unnamed protein product [Periconia digitata]|uniref:Uncharacterized protein n=1 Tax=Periconia digitata TaxID=1303443 RepID=A0A9W4XL43_9PLEO|nr:unnamed protein product [Periconia digitata]